MVSGTRGREIQVKKGVCTAGSAVSRGAQDVRRKDFLSKQRTVLALLKNAR
jgi:hypothetical protein